MSHAPACLPRGQRGVAALLVTAMLCFAMVLAVALAHRNVLVEEQRSANELRTARAFEAAEAGLEWALARINDPTPGRGLCRPGGGAHAEVARAEAIVCRYRDDDANIASSGDEANVGAALLGRNFLVVHGSESCPGTPTTEPHQS